MSEHIRTASRIREHTSIGDKDDIDVDDDDDNNDCCTYSSFEKIFANSADALVEVPGEVSF